MKFKPGIHGAIKSSPERERIIHRRSPGLRNRIIFSALAFGAIVACLIFLWATDSHRTETAVSDAMLAGQEKPLTKLQLSGNQENPTPTAVSDIDDSQPSAQGATESSPTGPTSAQSIPWLKILYPELVRISELEDEPAAMALAELVPMLASEDPVTRLAAIESAGDMTIPAVLPVLSMALSDPDPKVRLTALEALAARGDESVTGPVEACLYDTNPEVRLAAIDALAALEAKTAVYALASLLSDPDLSVRRQAVDALGDIGGESAMRYLLQARHDPNESIRINADAILAESNQAAYR